MKKTKGFTLIELLAVIVILAIVALIAVPLVISIITSSRKNSAQNSVNGYLKAVEFSIATYALKNQDLTVEDVNSFDGIYTCQNDSITSNNITIPINYKGSRVNCTIKIENKKISGEFEVNGFKFTYDGDKIVPIS